MPNNVFYSISPFGTGDIKVASDITIAGGSGVATFTVAQTGNIGVGCHVISSGVDGYISVMTNSTTATIVTALGVAHGNVSQEALTSIKHEYASLSVAEAGFTDASHINSTSLVTADVIANLVLYRDHIDDDEDTVAVLIQLPNEADTDSTRYINAYTPIGETQSINNNRHDGKRYDKTNGGYSIRPTSGLFAIAVDQPYTVLDGIQAELSNVSSGDKWVIKMGDTAGGSTRASGAVVKNTIVGPSPNAGAGVNTLFQIGIQVTAPSPAPIAINCLAHGGEGSGFKVEEGGTVYNSTSYGNDIGFDEGAGTNVNTVINCVSAGNTTTEFDTGFDATSNYNAADDTTAPGANSTDNITAADEFVSIIGGSEDFSLKSGAVLIGAGVDDPSSGLYSDDIKRVLRSSPWDIGAFEFVAVGGGADVRKHIIQSYMRMCA